jgi:hypothetical protein
VQEPFLYRVFGVFVREHDGACYRVGPPLMQPNQLRKRFRLAALCGNHQRVLALTRRFSSHEACSCRRR